MIIQFNSLSQLLHMGGYAYYVWPAYGIVALGLLTPFWWANKRVKRTLRQLQNSHEQAT